MAREKETKTAAADENRQRALESALAQIEKSFGKGSVMKLGDKSAHMNIETVSTGCLSLDLALGLGGVPKGRIIEIYGPESSGKTTVALHMVAEVEEDATLEEDLPASGETRLPRVLKVTTLSAILMS